MPVHAGCDGDLGGECAGDEPRHHLPEDRADTRSARLTDPGDDCARLGAVDELLIAHNPDPDSTLPFLLRVPLGVGLVFRTSGTWPRTKALYCYPVHAANGRTSRRSSSGCPSGPACAVVRRSTWSSTAAGRTARRSSSPGAAAGTWCSGSRHAPGSRPGPTWASHGDGPPASPNSHRRRLPRAVRIPVRRPAGHTRVAALACGDYGLEIEGALVASVERKSLTDFVSSVTGGRLRFALGELAALPRAAVVVEDRYSQLFKLDRVRPAVVLDGLAELQVRWPNVPIVFCETRPLAEEWTYRYLAAAQVWAETETAAVDGSRGWPTSPTAERSGPPQPQRAVDVADQTGLRAEVREWAIAEGMPVAERGRLRPEIWSGLEAGPSGCALTNVAPPEGSRGGVPREPSCRSGSAAAAGAAAALADVAGAGRTHLRPAGHAHRRVGGLALELLQQLGRRVDPRDLAG